MQTERDREIVDWIGRVGAAGAEHVQRRFGMGRRWAYHRLSLLVADRLLEQRSILYRQAGLYVATIHGLRWCGLQRLGTFRVGAVGFEHARELAHAAAELHHGLPGWRILSDRELRIAEADVGELIASARVGELPDGRPAIHRPDLALIDQYGRTVPVEIELSVKARRRLEQICRGYARARHLHHVYYLATPAAARAVTRAITDTRAEDRITVLPLGDIDALVQREREAAGASAR